MKRTLWAAYHWLTPVVDPLHVLNSVPAYRQFGRDWRAYSRLDGAEPLALQDALPCLHDRTSTTPFDAMYFYQDVWAFDAIVANETRQHLDVGSRVDFVGFLSTQIPVVFLDIRPFISDLPAIAPWAASLLALPLADRSVTSLSCLNVFEHIGLGRYGDELDPRGSVKAMHELARVLAPGGTLYFSGPIGRPRVCFNAHRIHAPHQIIEGFHDLTLVEFSAIDDRGHFVRNANPADFEHAEFSCGLFRFTR